MFDILVYVFENYLPEACPEPDALARKLSAVGFEQDAIVQALRWLEGLEEADEARFQVLPQPGTHRLFDEDEMDRISPECRGFLAFLELAGAIDPLTREMILERAMAVDPAGVTTISLGKFKVIVLMVMWRRQLPFDNLVFEDLLDDEDENTPPLMH
jgi:Smg protein